MFLIKTKGTLNLLSAILAVKPQARNYQVLHFHLNKISNIEKRQAELRIALNMIEFLFKFHEGGIFQLENNDIVILHHGEDKMLARTVIGQMAAIFIDDKEKYNFHSVAIKNLCSNFMLREQYETFTNSLKQALGPQEEDVQVEEKAIIFAPEVQQPITENFLDVIEKELVKRDLINVLRSQSIYNLGEDSKFSPLYQELYLSISHLSYVINQKINFKPGHELFTGLTEKLDIAMIRTLFSRLDAYNKIPIGLNINLKTLSIKEFDMLSKKVANTLSKPLSIELNYTDLKSHPDILDKHLELLKSSGIIMILDGMHLENIAEVKSNKYQFDYVKLQWNELKKEKISQKKQELNDILSKVGLDKIILYNCESKDSIDFGQSLGIKYFQGWYVDKLSIVK